VPAFGIRPIASNPGEKSSNQTVQVPTRSVRVLGPLSLQLWEWSPLSSFRNGPVGYGWCVPSNPLPLVPVLYFGLDRIPFPINGRLAPEGTTGKVIVTRQGSISCVSGRLVLKLALSTTTPKPLRQPCRESLRTSRALVRCLADGQLLQVNRLGWPFARVEHS